MRAPLRGSARRAAGSNPRRALPGWPTRRTPQCCLIAGKQGALASQQRSHPRGGAFGHSSLGAALPRGKIAPVCVLPECLTTERSDILQFEKRCEARQSEIRAGSVLAHVTKRIAAITPPRALVVLRFLLNTTDETDRIWPNPTTPCYLTNYCRSAETGEIFGIGTCRSPHMGLANRLRYPVNPPTALGGSHAT